MGFKFKENLPCLPKGDYIMQLENQYSTWFTTICLVAWDQKDRCITKFNVEVVIINVDIS